MTYATILVKGEQLLKDLVNSEKSDIRPIMPGFIGFHPQCKSSGIVHVEMKGRRNALVCHSCRKAIEFPNSVRNIGELRQDVQENEREWPPSKT